MFADIFTQPDRLPVHNSSNRPEPGAGVELHQSMSALGSQETTLEQGLKLAWPEACMPAVMQRQVGNDDSDARSLFLSLARSRFLCLARSLFFLFLSVSLSFSLFALSCLLFRSLALSLSQARSLFPSR